MSISYQIINGIEVISPPNLNHLPFVDETILDIIQLVNDMNASYMKQVEYLLSCKNDIREFYDEKKITIEKYIIADSAIELTLKKIKEEYTNQVAHNMAQFNNVMSSIGTN